jgi:hypothetical protein
VVYLQNLCNHQGGQREHMKLLYISLAQFEHASLTARSLYSHT